MYVCTYYYDAASVWAWCVEWSPCLGCARCRGCAACHPPLRAACGTRRWACSAPCLPDAHTYTHIYLYVCVWCTHTHTHTHYIYPVSDVLRVERMCFPIPKRSRDESGVHCSSTGRLHFSDWLVEPRTTCVRSYEGCGLRRECRQSRHTLGRRKLLVVLLSPASP
jgi:hypothetical protein